MPSQSKIQRKKRWIGVLRAWKRSGLSVSAFCRKNHFSQATFYAWKKRLSSEGYPGSRGHKTFLPVKVVTSSWENQPVLELALKNGRVLRLYREVPASVLAEMAQALEAEAC